LIVSCESCRSRYKLDDAKVSGRGAKITCPKCKHVFVVYAPGSAPAAPSPPTGRPAGTTEEDEPTRVGLPTTPSRPAAPVQFGTAGGGPLAAAPGGTLGGAVSSVSARSNPTLAVPLPDPAAPASHVVGGAPAHQPPPGPAVAPAEASARAAGLDFRKVGVPTWKVKVRIGLIYDFSDIKTLRKYITDGRVTPADVISYDGKAWKPIGEIADLDSFFLETYERLLRERGAAEPPQPKPLGAPTQPVAPTDEPRPGEPDPGLFRDPFEDLKTRQRERATQKRTAPIPTAGQPSASRSPLLLALVLVALGGGAYAAWKFLSAPDVEPTPVSTPVAEVAKPVREATTAKGPVWVPVEDPAAPEPEVTTLNPVASDPNVKVLPNGQIVRVVGPTGSGSTSSGGTTRSSSSSSSPVSAVKTSVSSASDYEAIGDGAARNKDWANAARAYQDAVSADPSSGRLLYKLGEAQYRAGQLDAAAATLQSASSRGVKDALKLAGAVAREQGDLSQANALYQQYLASGPKDAAEVERILKEMNGG